MHYLDVDPAKLRLIPEAVDHDLFRPGDADEARHHVAQPPRRRRSRSCSSSRRCGRTRTATGCCARSRPRRPSSATASSSSSGPGRDVEYVAELRALADELGIADDVVWVGGVPLEETVHFYRCADVFVYPSFNETFGLPILEAMAYGLPRRHVGHAARCRRPRAARAARRPRTTRSRSPTRSSRPAGRRATGCAAAGSGAGGRVHLGRHRGARRSRSTARSHAQRGRTGADEGPRHRRSRVHRLAHLRPAGRARPRRHRARRADRSGAPGRQAELPDARGRAATSGDVRNRDLLANLLRRVDAVYHFAAYQDYLPDFARFTDVNVVVDRADLRDRRRRAARPRPHRRGVLAVRDGGGPLPLPGRRRADSRTCAPRRRCEPAEWDIPCPVVRRTAGDAAHARADLQPAERRTACRSSARRWWPLNLGTPVRHPDGRAAVQHRPGPAAVGLQRLLRCVPDLLPALPARRRARRSTRTARRSGTTSTSTTSSTPTCWCSTTTGPPGGSSTSGAARGTRPRSSPTSSRGTTAPTSRARITGEYRFGDTRHICLGHLRAARQLGWAPRRTPADSVAEYADWLEGMPGPGRRAGRRRRNDARARRRPEGARDEGLPARRRASARRLRPITDTIPKCLVEVGGRPLLDIWLDALASGPASTRCSSTCTTWPTSVEAHLAARPGRRPCDDRHEPTLLGSAGTLLANRDWVADEEMFLACQRRQPHRLRPAGRSSRRTRRRGMAATLTVFRSTGPRPSAGSSRSTRRQRRRLRREAGRTRAATSPTPGCTPSARGARRDPRAAAARHRLSTCSRGSSGGPRVVDVGDAYFRDIGTPEASRRARRATGAGGRRMIITQTPLRVGLVGGGTDLPDYYREHGGRVLNCRDRQVRLRRRQAAIRRRHLRQLLEEGDRLAGRGPRARAGPRSHADDRGPRRRRDHHAGRHPVGGVRARIVLGGDGRPAAGAVRVPGAAGLRRGAGRTGLHHRDRPLPASRSASRTSTSPPTAGSATSASVPGTAWSPTSSRSPRRSAGSVQDQCCSSTPGHAQREHHPRRADAPTSATLPQLDLLRDLAGEAASGLA